MPSSACKTCARSEEHTSELQSHDNLVCRLLLEKKQHVPKAHCSGRKLLGTSADPESGHAFSRSHAAWALGASVPPRPRSTPCWLFFFLKSWRPRESPPFPPTTASPS